jgi:hypothetical protein
MGPSQEIGVLQLYFAKNYSMGLVSSVGILRKILESCENRTRSEKRIGKCLAVMLNGHGVLLPTSKGLECVKEDKLVEFKIRECFN